MEYYSDAPTFGLHKLSIERFVDGAVLTTESSWLKFNIGIRNLMIPLQDPLNVDGIFLYLILHGSPSSFLSLFQCLGVFDPIFTTDKYPVWDRYQLEKAATESSLLAAFASTNSPVPEGLLSH
jgi:hypothetical protein